MKEDFPLGDNMTYAVLDNIIIMILTFIGLFASKAPELLIVSAAFVIFFLMLLYHLIEHIEKRKKWEDEKLTASNINEMHEKRLNEQLVMQSFLAEKNARLVERENIINEFVVVLLGDIAHIRLEVSDNGHSDFDSFNSKNRIENGFGLKKIISYVEKCGGKTAFVNDNGFQGMIELPIVFGG